MLFKLYQIACKVSSLNFRKFPGKGLVELPSQISSLLYLGLGFALNSQACTYIAFYYIIPQRRLHLKWPVVHQQSHIHHS